ncbi:MAG: hypothetical protein AB8B81_06465 [Halioglobus sp.]
MRKSNEPGFDLVDRHGNIRAEKAELHARIVLEMDLSAPMLSLPNQFGLIKYAGEIRFEKPYGR